MKVLVPIKRVPDPYAKVKPLADGSGLDLSGIKFDINPFDEIAVEEAVRMKERDASVSIVAVSIGGAETEEQLRKALAMGADEAILIETTDALDPRAIAAELAALVNDLQPDVVLMGKQATDEDNNQVGQRLAAKLGWPQATFASKVSPAEGNVTVERETDDGGETLLLKTPCLITTDLRLNEPRYIALPGIIKARSKPLSKRERATSLEPQVKTLNLEAPPARAGGRKVGSVDELVDALKEMGVIA
ncbi:MAG: electron transfer flavoprotein subunit beta/FixA family protein [Armatimonadetes bacterium]|nr:electron transfer flavoprotein subunit beta/FixA family protein [Armatimonadota bacterium]